MKRKLGLGILGIGFAGKKHLEASQRVEGIIPIGICDTVAEEQQLKCLKEEYSLKIATTDYNELLECEDIDIISVCTPNYLHAEHVIKACEAGKHILCEKPLATTRGDCVKIINAVEKAKNKVLVGQVCRFSPVFETIKCFCEKGELGKLFYIEGDYIHNVAEGIRSSHKPWWKDPQNRHLCILGGGCHPIDLMRWIGGEVEEVFAYGSNTAIPDAPFEDSVIAALKFESGAVGKLFVSLAAERPYSVNLSVYGTEGTVMNNKLWLRSIPNIEKFVDLPITILNEHPYFDKELAHLEACIREDKNPKVSCEEGAKTVLTCLAIIESLDKGVPVKVNLDLEI